MSLGKGDTPDAPNYTNLANQTAQASRDATLLQSGLNRPTEINPYGSRQWALREGADPNNPQAGDWVVLDSLSGDQQGILDSRENIQLGMGTAAQGGVERLQDMMGTGLNTSGLPARSTAAIPDSENAFSADRQRVEDATYGRMTRLYDQQFGENEDALRNRLSNSGLMEGSEAYDKAVRDFTDQKNTAYTDAASRAVEMGGSEQSRQYGNLLQGIGAADTRRGNALNEELTTRQLPLNELNALLGGTQVSGGGGGAAFANAGLAQSPDYMSAANMNYNANMDAYNARAGGVGNATGLIGTLGSAWISSDRRLKSNISRVGTHSLGIGIYDYDIRGTRQRGVMADEVEGVMPEAVRYGDDGFAQVNYGMLGEL